MGQALPRLDIKKLGPTRDRLRDSGLVLSSLQRAFLSKNPRDWQYGLEVTMRGISTQAFEIGGQATRASIDLVRHKVRLDDSKWALWDCDGPELFKEVQVWLQTKAVEADLEEPKFSSGGEFDSAQADAYAAALWWMDAQLRILKDSISEGVTSPILLYPHHFDLALVWFPHDDERQLSVGFSTGDETVQEPYLYLTAYPEPVGFTDIKLPAEARWQKDGFSGAVLPYAVLAASSQPEELFKNFASGTFSKARPLLG